jgi:hypothetical protein
MSDITTVLQAAVGEEPPLGLDPAGVLHRAEAARRARRRRRGVAASGLVAGAAAAAVVAVGLATGPAGNNGHAARTGHLSLAALETRAASPAQPVTGLATSQLRARVDAIAAGHLAGLVQRDLGVTLAGTNVSVLPLGGMPGHFLDLAAGLPAAGHPYLNVEVDPADTMATSLPSCAQMSSLASGSGDGYYGPCRVEHLAGGSILVVRSGRTRQGGYTMAQALLVRPDGSSIFAENTNQAWPALGHWKLPKQSAGRLARESAKAAAQEKLKLTRPKIVRAWPEFGAGQMASLVRALGSV